MATAGTSIEANGLLALLPWPRISPPTSQTMVVHNAIKETNKQTRGDEL